MKNCLCSVIKFFSLTCLLVVIFFGCKKHENDISSWMTNYYRNPIPKQVKNKLSLIDDSKMLHKYPAASQPFQGFLTQFFIDNPEELKNIAQLLPALDTVTKKAVIRAIWFSRLPQSSLILDSIGFQFNNNPPDFDDFTEIQSFDSLYAGFLDFQWGRFFESGSRKPIEMIVRSLEYGEFLGSLEKFKITHTANNRENGIKEAAFKSAEWSLKSNAVQHPIIQNYLKEIITDSSLNPKSISFLKIIMDDIGAQKATKKDSSFYFSEIEYFSTICNTYRPDFKEMEQYGEWINRLKSDVKLLEDAKPLQPWTNLALGELYRLGWNLSIDGYSTKAITILSDTNSSDKVYKCRQKMALGKFLLNIDISYNGDGIRILQDVKNDCVYPLPEVLWWISYGYLVQGYREMAISYLKEYLTIVPSDSSAIHNLKVLEKEDMKIKQIKQ